MDEKNVNTVQDLCWKKTLSCSWKNRGDDPAYVAVVFYGKPLTFVQKNSSFSILSGAKTREWQVFATLYQGGPALLWVLEHSDEAWGIMNHANERGGELLVRMKVRFDTGGLSLVYV